MSVNKVILIGRLGQDPEVRFTQGGTAVANFNLATNEAWTDKSGQRQERTEWHRIVVWGKQAELAQQYLSKGRQVFIEGKLQTRQWQDQQGQNRYTTEVQAQSVRFLGGGAQASGGGAYAANDGPNQHHQAGGFVEPMGGPPAGGPGMDDATFTEDDIPF